MGQKAEIRLDILIKRVDDYYQAHCLQFDIVATSDSLGGSRSVFAEESDWILTS